MMKNRSSKIFLGFAFVFATGFPVTEMQAIGHGKTSSPAKSVKVGRVIVQRAPNFGSGLVVRLSIDGTRVANIPRNQHYGDIVPAGRHVLSVVVPNSRAQPTSVRLSVKSGHVYIYTVAWASGRVLLQLSNFYSPSRRVNEEVKTRKVWPWERGKR
jgi:hypothetical protein